MSDQAPGTDLPLRLFGDNPEERIVAVHVLQDDGPPAATVYLRSADDRVSSRIDPVYPFVFVSRIRDLETVPRGSYKLSELAGSLEYRYLVFFDSWSSYHHAIHKLRAGSDLPAPGFYEVGSPMRQYLLQTGRTLFKGMEFDELHRLQLDIEVRSSRGFPDARRVDDEIIVIALSDNRGWSAILDSRIDGEAGLLRRMTEAITLRDPDVIEGHNIFRFDLPYIQKRCRRHGMRLNVGRDGSEPRESRTNARFAERSFEFTTFEIAGRHVVDTFLLLMAFDATKRNLPGYGLKDAARYFGIAAGDRTYVEGDDITRTWIADPERLIKYAHDDIRETAALARHLSGASFYVTQMTPLPYQDVARSGTGVKIESLMVREYLRARHSLPASRPVGNVSGAYTDVFVTGVVGPIVYADVESLYPSIMLGQNIRPATDVLGVFPQLLRHLTTLRLDTKAQMADETEPLRRSELDARQSSFKILINSFYGYLAYGRALFNDSSEADRVTRAGQANLRTLISAIVMVGGRVVEVDTDGVFFQPPDGIRTAEEERAFVAHLNRGMPEGINVAMEGRYQRMLSYKMKNYALLDYGGRLTIRGSSLISRSTERFARTFVKECIRLTLDEDIAALHNAYLRERSNISRHLWRGVEDFSRRETIKDALETYRAEVRDGRRQRSAAYEVALTLDRRGRRIRTGDRVSYYIGRSESSMPLFELAKPAEDWRADAPDENVGWYLRRLDEVASKFAVFFSPTDYRRIFSEEDLFGFDPTGVSLVTTESVPGEFQGSEP
jgi:DNA polymerase elongation subunit (family B)